MSAAETVRARITPELKKEASAVLADMGLTVSDAIRLLLVRVASERAFPFEVRTPNATTRAAMEAGDTGDVARFANVDDLMSDLGILDVPENRPSASKGRQRAPARA